MIYLIGIFLLFVENTFAGNGDTLEHLKVSFGNIDMNHHFDKAEVETLFGKVPEGLEGTLVRQGCGVFGNSFGGQTDNLDRVTHLFDCIELAQSFHFHDEKAFFTSRFYDTNKNDYFKYMNQSMEKSSVYYWTVYSNYSEEAISQYNAYRSENEETVKVIHFHQSTSTI